MFPAKEEKAGQFVQRDEPEAKLWIRSTGRAVPCVPGLGTGTDPPVPRAVPALPCCCSRGIPAAGAGTKARLGSPPAAPAGNDRSQGWDVPLSLTCPPGICTWNGAAPNSSLLLPRAAAPQTALTRAKLHFQICLDLFFYHLLRNSVFKYFFFPKKISMDYLPAQHSGCFQWMTVSAGTGTCWIVEHCPVILFECSNIKGITG